MRNRRLVVLIAVAFVLCPVVAVAAATGPFRDITMGALPSRSQSNGALELPLPARFRALEIDVRGIEQVLAAAPRERSAAASARPLLFALPYPDGTDRLFRVEEAPILEPALAARFPEIRTFVAQGIDDPTATARLSLTSLGFHAMVLSASGTVYIDPYRRWDTRYALSYFKGDGRRAPGAGLRCEVRDEPVGGALAQALDAAPPATGIVAAAAGAQLRTYRLALAATGEYTTAVCAPNPAAVPCAMNAIAVSVARVVGIYEREVAIRMVLVANNNLVVYTNGASDPYTNNNGGAMLTQNQTNLDTVIGSANYDVGHVFSTGGGGVANLNVPCTSSKARGVTGSSNPIGDGFDVDYVAHEMGHQFGGSHTFNGTTSNCGGGNRSASSAYEPGSGTTIMAYAGICGAENLQPNSDDTFHTRSFDQIVTFSTGVTGSSCASITATGNTPPTVNAGATFTIPRQTPFTLTGSATDPDPDTLTYMWEEFDLGTAAPPNDDVAAVRPIFRSFVPLTVPSRTFPKLSDILANVAVLGESMSTRNRTMTFRMTARDNRAAGGGVNYASTTVTVNATAGPFAVTQPNTALTWAGNSAQTVTWNVAGTTAAPVSCANVAIELSTNGGTVFSATLAASTANDGTEVVTIPNTPTATARVRVSCVGNIFFDISNTNFTITAGTGAPAPDLVSILPVTGPTAGGTAVTLTGTDFVNGATVLFGAVSSASVTFNSSASLTATAPAQGAGTVAVKVTNPDSQNDTLNAAFTYVTPPDLISVSPTSGSIVGGNEVTLTGTNFVSGATVQFGAVSSPSVTFNGSTALIAVAPAQGAGTVAVTVTNPDTQSDTLGSAYSYLATGFYSLVPCRVIDTRNPDGLLGGPALAGSALRAFPIGGSCGVPPDALAVAVNVTVTAPSAAGALNVFANGIPPPLTSVINFGAGQTRANSAIVSLANPALDVLYAAPVGSTAHFVLDVMGYFR